MRLIVVVIYVPKFVEESDHELDEMSKNKTPIVSMGDFNIDIFKRNELTSLYSNTFNANDFDLLTNTFMRVSDGRNFCLDHVTIRDCWYMAVLLFQT